MAVTLNANTSTGFIATSDTSGVLQLQTGGTTAVSIGTDQSFNFSVTGQRITGDFSNATIANRVAFQTSTANGNTGVYFLPNGTATTSNVIVSNASDPTNSALGILGAISSDIRISSAISGTGTYLPMTFYTGGSESLRLSATTKAVILAGGSTSANGTGITFPAVFNASSDVNTLDDYEEGVWTPTAIGFSVNTGWSGTYTKIGRLVYLTARNTVAITATRLTSYLTGLPFAVAQESALNSTSDTSVQNLGVGLTDTGGTNGRMWVQSWTSAGTPYITTIYITNT